MPTIRSVVASLVFGGLCCSLFFAGPVSGPEAGSTPHSIVRLPPGEVKDAARSIDTMVRAELTKAGLAVTPVTSDSQFIRRAYLTLAGRIPGSDEVREFALSTSSDKRRALVEHLTTTPAYRSQQFLWLADLLRVQSRPNQVNTAGQPYIDFLKAEIAANTPWDVLVRKLLTAEGAALAPGNGATGFWLRDAGMPLDHMANLTRTMIGTQIGCAQCHDHPYDTWTRHDFYEVAAFTAGTSVVRRLPGESPRARVAATASMAQLNDPDIKRSMQILRDSLGSKVVDTGKWHLNLPRDYQYPDHKPGAPTAAKPLWGTTPPIGTSQRGRAIFAEWMTSSEHPRFAQVIANRMWKKVFGVGLVEPIDAWTDATKASNPELLDFLGRLMVSLSYDLAHFQSVLCSTEAFQRQATARDVEPDAPRHVGSPVLRRLSAEQVWDSLCLLMDDDVDLRKGPDASRITAFYAKHANDTSAEILELAVQMADARKELADINRQLNELTAQARSLKSGPALVAIREQIKALSEKRELISFAGELKGRPPLPPVPATAASGQRPGSLRRPVAQPQREYQRASELPQPAAPGHFLRVFGQSDRKLIENSSREGTITQALHLMNGIIDQRVLASGSSLSQLIAAEKSGRDRIQAVYLAVLSRAPTADEEKAAQALLAGDESAGLKDLVWALINSAEFLFVQ